MEYHIRLHFHIYCAKLCHVSLSDWNLFVSERIRRDPEGHLVQGPFFYKEILLAVSFSHENQKFILLRPQINAKSVAEARSYI